MAENLTSAEILVSGIVQGVGYRYFVRRVAAPLTLKGYVLNTPDGGVKVRVEGEKTSIQDLIKHLRQGPMGARVDDVKVNWGNYVGKYKDFSIAFHDREQKD